MTSNQICSLSLSGMTADTELFIVLVNSTLNVIPESVLEGYDKMLVIFSRSPGFLQEIDK